MRISDEIKVCKHCQEEFHPVQGRENTQLYCCTSCAKSEEGIRRRERLRLRELNRQTLEELKKEKML